MIRSALTKNVPLKLASLFMALVLWVYVLDQSEHTEKTPLNLDVKFSEPPKGMVRVSPDETEIKKVVVNVTGPREVDAADLGEFTASIDLSKAGKGTNRCRVNLIVPPAYLNQNEWTCETSPTTIEVVLDDEIKLEKDVELKASGIQPPMYIYGGATIQPKSAVYRGAKQFVDSVVQIRAILDLSTVAPGSTAIVKLEALDRNNKPVRGVVCEPAVVAVRPAVMPAPTAKYLVVTPTWEGAPALGYRMVSCKVEPNQVYVTGSSEVLSNLVSVETEPISIQGLRDNATIVARLKMPKGVDIARSKGETVRKEPTVQVVITFEQAT